MAMKFFRMPSIGQAVLKIGIRRLHTHTYIRRSDILVEIARIASQDFKGRKPNENVILKNFPIFLKSLIFIVER